MSYGSPTGGYYPPPGGNQPPPGGGYPPPSGRPPKQGMSTGAKIGIFGCGGCLGLVILGFVLVMFIGAVASTDTGSGSGATAVASPSEETAEAVQDTETEEAPAGEAPEITMTAANAGTAGDTIDNTVYTVIDIEITNNSHADLDVNPMYFTVILEDGTAVSEWADTIFADIDHLDTVTLRPGEKAGGQIAVVGEVEVESVRMEELMGLGEEVTAVVE